MTPEEVAALAEQGLLAEEQEAKPDGTDFSDPDQAVEPKIVAARVATLSELISQRKIDLALWEVQRHVVNQWETFSNEYGIVPLYQVKAWLTPRREVINSRCLIAEQIEAMQQHAPVYEPIERKPDDGHGRMLEVCVFDNHFGSLAWGLEVDGASYDSKIAKKLYLEAFDELLEYGRRKNVVKVLLPVGNDMLHVDSLVEGKVYSTSAGTPQDVDTRFKKMFTTAREALVEAIDRAREVAPVEVVVVPGNHDTERMFCLGDSIQSWFRDDPEVEVDNRPALRKYKTFGTCLIGYTHGNKVHKGSGPRPSVSKLPLLMPVEAREEWSKARWCEWHIGHFHRKDETEYKPTWEENGIRVRVIPSLVAHDAWHYTMGFVRTQRSAEAYLWHPERGNVGMESHNIDLFAE
jgi:hypothetical protein